MAAELAVAIAGEALGSLAYKIGAVTYGEFTHEQNSIGLEGSALLFQDASGNRVSLTDAQVEAIGRFIDTPEVTALAQAYSLAFRTKSQKSTLTPILKEAEESFTRLFDSSFPQLQGTAIVIWNLINDAVQSVAPAPGALEHIRTEDLTKLFDSQKSIPEKRPPAPFYIREILSVTKDWRRIDHLRGICVDVCRAAQEEFSSLHLEHTQDRNRFSQEQLYIDRTLRTVVQGKSRQVQSNFITHPAPGTNIVVLGNPGAGKSTLVARAMYLQSVQPEADFAPVILRCRELNSESGNVDLLDELTKRLATIPGVNADRADLESLLSLGRALVIFDGIDEIVDLPKRRRVVTAIEGIAAAFPLASLVCTTRIIGYESARFESTRFTTATLQEFTHDQVREYATRWFTIMGRPEVDSIAFMQDSEEIDEIRRNPLMLSLLCNLYRVRGYIPMNRLDVYRSCADLLFYSWDSLRHIPQPVDHRRYGHSLMEELADFFFKFPSAAGGIQERQLVKLIAIYFQDTAGVELTEANLRASDFLEFCAGRAWLLTAIGRDVRGDRLFAFTHRTFMEFYAAQAVVRRAKSERDVLQKVLEAYSKNPSSVFPDIMLEAYDVKEYRGAETLLRSIMHEGKVGRMIAANSHFPLCLRILNSTPVAAPLVREVLVKALTTWEDVFDARDRSVFTSLLQLYRDPRNICRKILLREEASINDAVTGNVRRAFLRRWSRLALLGRADVFLEEWADIVQTLAREEGPKLARIDAVVNTFLRLNDHGLDKLPDLPLASALTLHCFDENAPGILLRAVREILSEEEADESLLRYNDHYGSRLASRPAVISEKDGATASLVVGKMVPSLVDVGHDRTQYETVLLLWLACVLSETTATGLHPFHEVVRGIVPEDLLFRAIAKRMEVELTDSAAAEELSKIKIGRSIGREVAANCPTWFKRWMLGQLSLVSVPRDR